jgi:hypothetical protein
VRSMKDSTPSPIQEWSKGLRWISFSIAWLAIGLATVIIRHDLWWGFIQIGLGIAFLLKEVFDEGVSNIHWRLGACLRERRDMQNIVHLSLVVTAAANMLFAAECSSVRVVESNGQIAIQNASEQAILAYIFASTDAGANGSPTHRYSGVFSGKDVFAPGKTIEHGKADSDVKFFVDYVRFVNGSTCGDAVTDAAKKVIERLDKSK